ncbi:MAG TPA: lamin tail domain-containing protein [Bacteroidales bacterium]|nr:lamin tail domain-containing protein [Bacteroidales bacterium]
MKNVIFTCIAFFILFIKGSYSGSSVCASGESASPGEAEPGDVIISEIMADPSPAVSLPEREYLEITSLSDFVLSLEGWYLLAGNSKYYFPSVQIAPDEYIILCHVSDTQRFSGFGRTAGFKSFPALNDDGKLLVIFDKTGKMIHGAEYSPKWYGDDLKSGGGWSLEMIDLSSPFNYNGNWRASVSPTGGTPGRINSVRASNPDNLFEGITNVFPADSVSVRVTFSEPVKIIESLSKNIKVNDLSVKSLSASDPLRREFIMELNGYIRRKTVYSLSLPPEVTDYAGNPALKRAFDFGSCEEPLPGEITFNELLFNPLPGDAGYIEIVNISGKIIDASGISVSSRSPATGKVSAPVTVSDVTRCILPGAYYAFTTDRSAIISRYFSSRPDRIFGVGRMPSMPDDEGMLVLFNRSLEILDEVSYSEKQHNAFIKGREGIAIEKIKPEALSSFTGNWHSASEASGWGTPGKENSVLPDAKTSGKPVSLSSTRITPDNDGFEDILVIRFNPEGEGNVTNVTIYDEAGLPVKKVAVNFFIGSGGELFWDGTADDGSLVPQGLYVVLVTLFSDRGRAQSWKMGCALLRK